MKHAMTLIAGVLATALIVHTSGGQSAPSREIVASKVDGVTAVGTAVFRDYTEEQKGVGSMPTTKFSSKEWVVDITVRNATAAPLTLDNTIMIVESGQGGRLIEGTMLIRNERIRNVMIPPLVRDKKTTDYSWSYGILTFFSFKQTAGIFMLGSRYVIDPTTPLALTKPATYGLLEPGSTFALKEAVRIDEWLESETRDSVFIVLPEIHTGDRPPFDSYQPVAVMQPSETETNVWTVKTTRILHETIDAMTALLMSRTEHEFIRIVAANRLAEYYPSDSTPTLVTAAKTLEDGPLLVALLSLAERMRLPDLVQHATSVSHDTHASAIVRHTATMYLEAMK